jgi:AraC family transcriptional regulator, transcriptional activator of pobA
MDYIEPLSRDPAERESGFFLLRLDGAIVPESYSGLQHRHDFQEILVLQSGQGRHTIDEQPIDFCPQTVCFIAKGHVHIIEEATGLTGWLIRFTNDFLPAAIVSRTLNYHMTLFSQLDSPNRTLTLQPSEMRDLERVLELIESEYVHHATFQKQNALRLLLSLLIIRIERTYQNALSTKHHQHDELSLYQQFMTLLEHDFACHHDVQYYAKALHTSRFTLSKILGRILGRPTKQLIEERIILEAKRYLHYTDLSIKEIAFALGYTDLFHLSKTFKRSVGIAPHAFREQRHKKT